MKKEIENCHRYEVRIPYYGERIEYLIVPWNAEGFDDPDHEWTLKEALQTAFQMGGWVVEITETTIYSAAKRK